MGVDLGELQDICKHLANTLYIGPFRNAINVGGGDNYFDIRVGQPFIKQWRELKSGRIVEQNEAAVRLTKDIRNLFGFDELEINASSDDKTLQIIVNGRSYKLPEIGSGLTQFILVLAQAARQRPSFILIDEPELNLHPTLQIDFLTTLASYAEKGVFFATHNFGLARACADRIYAVRSIAHGKSSVTPIEQTSRLSEMLGELSYSEYRELGFDSVLLVEGPTELKTIQQFLRFYGKDHKVVLLPLGGGELIHGSSEVELEEIKRICDNISAVIDSERESENASLEAKRQEFAKLCNSAGINCHILRRRAIENYFTDDAVKRVKGDKYSALGEFEALKDAQQPWAKAGNWRIAREMHKEDLDATDLGDFLSSL